MRQIVGLAGLFGGVQLVTAFVDSRFAFLCFLMAVGFTNLILQTVANSAVQLWTAPSVRGRVLGVYGQVFVGGTPIGAPIVGALTLRCGGRLGMALCGAVPLIVAALVAAVLAARRHRRAGEIAR
ncbi:MAG: MFS transporter [Kineosporiaceae bacterium]